MFSRRKATPETLIGGERTVGMTDKGKSRECLEVGQTKWQHGLIGAHDGSALFSFGPTTSLATLSGPMEVRLRDELTDRAALEVNLTPLQGVPGVACTSFEQALHDLFASVVLLHLHPRALLQLNLQTYARPPLLVAKRSRVAGQRRQLVQESRPDPDRTLGLAERAAHINAASLAFLDARTPMRATVLSMCACFVARGTRTSLDHRAWRPDSQQSIETDRDMDIQQTAVSDLELVLDPSPAEEALSQASFLFAFAFSGAKPFVPGGTEMGVADLVLSQASGRFSWKEVSLQKCTFSL